jgi:DNA-binding CsgD family transcriptional regulator
MIQNLCSDSKMNYICIVQHNKGNYKQLKHISQIITNMNPLTNNYGIPALDFEVGILTKREVEIIERSLLQDRTIAHHLNISYYTVLSHLKNIRNKTGLQNKEQMVYFGLKSGIIN